MNFLKSMDLYQGIVLLSVVLLPAGGWWVNGLNHEIELCETALDDATRRGGFLEEIGELQKKIEVVAQNRRTTSDAILYPSEYFQEQIIQVNPSIKKNDFVPGKPNSRVMGVGGGSKSQAREYEVAIAWGQSGRGRDPFLVQMDFIYAVIFNCESGAKRGLSNGSPSVWRLRKLNIENEAKRLWRSNKTPAPEMEDKWLIKSMTFGRREPVAKKK